jgi:hypothetical protein
VEAQTELVQGLYETEVMNDLRQCSDKLVQALRK